MSREVRRVPLDWTHPVEFNPHWVSQQWGFHGKRPQSRLHRQDERFIGLMTPSFSEAHQEWEEGKRQWEAGTHESLLFSLKYHAEEGYLNRDGVRETPRPYNVYGDDGETVVRSFYPKTVQEIIDVYPYSDYDFEPTSATHMPDFNVPDVELGWCLYETVSEGTPTTPVFATADELIEHLATVGQDYDQIPMRRTAAEALVRQGGSFGSMLVSGGRLYDSANDADLIAALPKAVDS